MDSEDEDEDAASAGSRGSPPAARAAGSSRPSREAARQSLPLPQEVRSFSEMVRLAPDVERRASGMAAGELAAVCAAAARVKFYDAAMFAAVTSRLRRLLTRPGRGQSLASGELVAVLGGLAELNAYDRELFAAAMGELERVNAVDSLDGEQRKRLLGALRSSGHDSGGAFVERLAQREKRERYEVAKDEVWQRKLSGMYGETRDLQGAPEDTERALLAPSKRPRIPR